MKWPWERTEEQKSHDTAELEVVQDRLKYVMSELRKTLDKVETKLERELRNGA